MPTNVLACFSDADAFPTAGASPAAVLQAKGHGGRRRVTSLLQEALGDCGCWVLEQSETACGLSLLFEVSLRAVAELFASLMECGLELDRRGHNNLAVLCTVSQHALGREGPSRVVALRLEVAFAKPPESLPVFRRPPQA